jgi:hypothetical protein
MLHRYAFIDANGIVVNVIVGDLDQAQQQVFLDIYRGMFGAQSVVEVVSDIAIWIGGSYTGGEFLPPAEPEPAPEPLPEPLPETQMEPEI